MYHIKAKQEMSTNKTFPSKPSDHADNLKSFVQIYEFKSP